MKIAFYIFFIFISFIYADDIKTPIVIDLKIESGDLLFFYNGVPCQKSEIREKLKGVYRAFGKDECVQILTSKDVTLVEVISLRDLVVNVGFSDVRIFIPRIAKDGYFLSEVTIHAEKKVMMDNVPPVKRGHTSNQERK